MSSSAVKSIPNILGRNLIKRDIVFQDFGGKVYTYDDLCLRINQAKQYMLDCGIKKESLISLVTLSTTLDWVAMFFATFELGCVLIEPHDEMWYTDTRETWRQGFLDLSERSDKWGDDNTFMFSDMNDEIATGIRKGDIYNGGGFWLESFHGYDPYPISGIDNFSTEDIQAPWDVSENSLALYTSSKIGEPEWQPELHTHKDVYHKSQKVIDIFGYADKTVALTKTQGHMCAVELLVLPTFMSSEKVCEMPMPDDDVGLHGEILKTNTTLIKRRGIDIVFGVDKDLITLPDNIRILEYTGNVYGDMESLPTCL
jgi:hypothetical protein